MCGGKGTHSIAPLFLVLKREDWLVGKLCLFAIEHHSAGRWDLGGRCVGCGLEDHE